MIHGNPNQPITRGGRARLSLTMNLLPLITALSVFATQQFCNTDMTVDCAKLNAGCSGPSPNCPGQGNYTGTVSNPGSRLLVKAAGGRILWDNTPRELHFHVSGWPRLHGANG